MKILPAFHRRARRRANRAGFTLSEIMVAMTIFLLLLGGIIFVNIFGLKMFQLTSAKLNVTQWARETREQITQEVRRCNQVQVGNVTNGNFVAFLDGEIEQGNGLLIYPTTDTNSFIIYFLNAADQTLRRTTDQFNSTVILASSVTNTLPFSAQDLSGNVLTNNLSNRVIHLALEFYQPQRFLLGADYYKVETSMKQRVVP